MGAGGDTRQNGKRVYGEEGSAAKPAATTDADRSSSCTFQDNLNICTTATTARSNPFALAYETNPPSQMLIDIPTSPAACAGGLGSLPTPVELQQ